MTTTELLRPLRHTPASKARPRRPVDQDSPTTEVAVADPAWARPALIALLALTALAYIWDLSASGYANSFYAAAVQAGTKSWKAFFFGSLDSSNFITVDKPPASLWVMALSGRIFGFSSWSMLVPQALEGVAAVGLLHATVKRRFGAGAGLLAGVVFAATPVAALMFRFNNPDALLVMLMVAGAYCLTRALEKAGTRWILAAGTMIGLAFLAKMMQAFLVLPAFALVYAVAAPTTLRRRLVQIVAGGAAVIASAGWWVAIVALWPAGSRPMIDGSPDNSILNLITGYNGLGRIFGSSAPGGGGGGGGANFSGATGPLRLFNDLMGGQASWLLPAALLALVGGLWARRHAPRTDQARAALLLWGGWLLVTGAVFSFGQGVIHTYYTVALAPALGALVAIGASMLWSRRDRLAARLLAATAVAASATWAFVLLDRTPNWLPWLRIAIVLMAAVAIAALLLASTTGLLQKRALLAAAVLGVMACISGPLAYAADTVTTGHTGSIVSAGPTISGAAGGGAPGTGGPGGGARPGAAGGGIPSGAPSGSSGAASPSGQALFGNGSSTGKGSPPTGGTSSLGGPPSGSAKSGSAQGRSGSPGAGAGGGMGNASVSAKLVKALRSEAGSFRWAAATSGSESAASLELASGQAVMGIGGFNNEGGNLSLSAFEKYVAKGEIHYYIASAGAGGGMPGAARSGESIASWVEAHFKARTIGGQTVYDLTKKG